jgi:cobaltochelatase CobS
MNATMAAVDLAAAIRSKTKPTGAINELKVDPYFEEDLVAAKVVEFGIKTRQNVLIVGPTGSGKSSLAINIMARLKESAEICNCSGETSTDEIIAKQGIINVDGHSITTTILGAALRAYKDGKILLLEEVDFAIADILASLHRIMETNQQFYICNIGEPEVIQKSSRFAVISTANTIGTGEDSFMYNGTKPLNQAFMNRFSLTIRLGYIAADKEIKVLVNKTGIDKNVASVLVQCANDVRDAADPTRISGSLGSQTIASVISTRDLISWATAIKGMSLNPMEAAKYSFLNRINDADRDFMVTALQNRGIR